ncbi:endonuclease MutS2 [Cellulosilyticum sp. WCF-2]|uniref:endonuclease MutS2 n=1 Tax=Cellulosilyticum sp. WCF-2 TaxID=2497860 RepID=UPI000F8E7664|nr:DNA mismatch repair protein MutS [Cellulosilyticum sp. WCF-2]QEH67051.1 DNA mismatch repair protein MutS [Cellulosilyticum sp. WCF-2]
MKQTIEILEFNKILKLLSEMAVSDKAKQKLLGLEMILDEKICQLKMRETTEARRILDSLGTPPISSMQYMESMLERVSIGTLLMPEELMLVASFIKGCNNMRRYLSRAEFLDCNLATYGRGFCDLDVLKELIELSIRNNQVDSEASTALKGIRRDIEIKREQVKQRLEKIMRGKKDYLADFYIIERGGRYALAVKREYKSQVEGAVLDTSRTGSTVFIEPSAVGKLQEELRVLEIEEDNEVRKVLYSLTNEVENYISDMRLNMEMMEVLDVAFAKAKLSQQLQARAVKVSVTGKLEIKEGRHPLLNKEKCVPLDFYMKDGIRGIIVTGPNTGGKTVALKTVGLLSMMAQCGLHVPVAEGSTFKMFNQILCDIGDGQSIEESLSTFSSHIVNIIDILKQTTKDSLVLLDELGSGTDPAEGMGIAIAILEALRQKECLLVATTHYPEVKDYATEAEGYQNARMCFDKESLKPLYKLEIGEAGESCAFYIAEKLGFPKSLIQLASSYTYKEQVMSQDDYMNKVIDKRTKAQALENGDSNTIGNEKPQTQASGNHDSSRVEGTRGKEEVNTNKEIPTNHIVNKKTNNSEAIEKAQGLIKALDSELGKVAATPQLKGQSERKEKASAKAKSFHVGDSVLVFPNKEKGLVFHTVNEEGKIGVQIKGSKRWVAVKRLKLLVAASELYPADYDFSIVFDSVANRKAKKKMTKGYQEGMSATYESEEEASWQSYQ